MEVQNRSIAFDVKHDGCNSLAEVGTEHFGIKGKVYRWADNLRGYSSKVPRFACVLCMLTWVEEYSRKHVLILILPISRGPLRFDFHDPDLPQRVVSKATPLPVSGFCHQFSRNRIPVDISQFDLKFVLIPDIAVLVTLLLERTSSCRTVVETLREP